MNVVILAVVVSYLLGSISTSTLLSKTMAGMDIREHGSGNAGATNTLRVLGWRFAVIVLVVDILKGIVAVMLARWLAPGNEMVAFADGFAVIVGHNWPIFFGFRGGKGIATTIGVLVLVMPLAAITAGIIAILLLIVTRYVSLAAMAFTILTAILVLVVWHHPTAAVFGAVIALLSIYRHRKNISRLVRGQENKIFRHRA